jgi:hypothetical protein
VLIWPGPMMGFNELRPWHSGLFSKINGARCFIWCVRLTMHSQSSIHKKALLFTRICAGVAVVAFVIRVVSSGGFHPAFILLSYIAVVALLSRLLRKRGSSRRKAALFPNAPMAGLMIVALIFDDTNRAIERQLLPGWVVAAIFLAIGLVMSTIMVCRGSKKSEDSV